MRLKGWHQTKQILAGVFSSAVDFGSMEYSFGPRVGMWLSRNFHAGSLVGLTVLSVQNPEGALKKTSHFW